MIDLGAPIDRRVRGSSLTETSLDRVAIPEIDPDAARSGGNSVDSVLAAVKRDHLPVALEQGGTKSAADESGGTGHHRSGSFSGLQAHSTPWRQYQVIASSRVSASEYCGRQPRRSAALALV